MARAVSKARGEGTTISEVFEAAVAAIAEALDASGMTKSSDYSPAAPTLISARAFYRSSFGNGDLTMTDASEALPNVWGREIAALSTFGCAAPVAVPVAALGCDESADGDVVVEVHFEGGGDGGGGSSFSSDDDE